MRRLTPWSPWLLALGIAFLGLIGGQAAEHLQREHLAWEERGRVSNALAQIRAHLESTINGNLLMVNGLTAVIAAQPDIDQQAFSNIARGMIGDDTPLRNIAGAPDLVIRLMYPIAGNEAAIGLDYRQLPAQRAAALTAVEQGRTVLAGPLQLVQGGTALVAREPVFIDDDAVPGGRRLWGLVAAVLDIERLYELAGVHEISDRGGIQLALRGRDGLGRDGEPFYGDAALFKHDPVTASIQLPTGSWLVAATPAGGWQDPGDDPRIMRTRIISLSLTALMAMLAYFVSRNAMALRRSDQELRDSQALFTAFMHNLPAGAFVRDIASDKLLFENHWMRANLPLDRHVCGTDSNDDLASLRDKAQLTHQAFQQTDGDLRHCDTLRFVVDDNPDRPLVGGVIMDVTPRVEAERGLNSSRARLRTLVDTLPDLIWMKDRAGRFLACNRRFETFFGVREQDIIGRTVGDLSESSPMQELQGLEQDYPMTDHSVVVEREFSATQDGERLLFDVTTTPVHDKDDTPIGILGIARDVTERRAAELALRTNTERLENAERLAHIGNWDYRISDGHITLSAETCRIFGFEPDQSHVDLSMILERVCPDDRAEMDEFLHRSVTATAEVGIAPLHCRVRGADGSTVDLVIRARTEFGADDQAISVFGTVQDVSERKRTETALQDREERLRLALSSANQGLWDLDLGSGDAIVSPEYAEMLGYEPSSFHETNQAWRERLHPDDAVRVAQTYEEYVAGKIDEYRVEFRLRTRDGSWKWILSIGQIKAWDEQGRPIRMLGTHTDIGALKEAQQEILELNRELERRVEQRTEELAMANRELETFTYTVSHDLKAPLRGIDGYSRLLLEEHARQLDSEGIAFLHNVRHGVEQMGQLIDDLLTYSRMERRAIRADQVNLAKIVAAIIDGRRRDIAEADVEISLAVDIPDMQADADGLRLALRNLVDNALKFHRSGPGAKIAISAESFPDSTRITVADNGIGFDMRFHDRIFDIFQRLHRAEEFPGTGIGLAIVRKAMQRMGGHVHASSEPGKGATFTLEFPK